MCPQTPGTHTPLSGPSARAKLCTPSVFWAPRHATPLLEVHPLPFISHLGKTSPPSSLCCIAAQCTLSRGLSLQPLGPWPPARDRRPPHASAAVRGATAEVKSASPSRLPPPPHFLGSKHGPGSPLVALGGANDSGLACGGFSLPPPHRELAQILSDPSLGQGGPHSEPCHPSPFPVSP